jgi:hypothetical protein
MLAALLLSSAMTGQVQATEIDTNIVHAGSAPSWLKASRVDRVADQIQSKLEWDIRKVQLRFYTDQAAFRQAHGFDDTVLAYSRKQDNSVNIGPRVADANFDQVFGHELVHIIIFQKYKDAIPKWLEEGLANYLSKHGKVDYAWLAQQPARDVRTLSHPFVAGGGAMTAGGGARFHYQASQALMEMIAVHCPVTDLLQLSVGKGLERYLPTLCGINDLNAEYATWVKRKAQTSR